MTISKYIQRSEPIKVNNLALMLEKALDDKLVLSEAEQEELEKIMKLIEEAELSIYNFSNIKKVQSSDE